MTPFLIPQSAAERMTRAAFIALGAPDPAACIHLEISVVRSIGSTFDDHETVYGCCKGCGAWVVSTLHFGGGEHIETRPMTDDERTRYQALEDRAQRDEWLADFQEGAA